MGIIHKNMTIEAQAAEVDKVKRSESGMIVDPVTVAPTQRVAEALDVMAKFRISGVPVTIGTQARGDPDQPRPALRDAHQPARLRPDDQGRPDHGPRGHDPRAGQGDPPPPQGREAPGRGPRLQPEGPHHGQGHPEADQVPVRGQGLAGPAARGRGHRRHRGRARPRDRARRGEGRRPRHRHRARPHHARAAHDRGSEEALPGDGGRGRQRRHVRRRRRADLRRRGRGQGRHGPGLDLHHARRLRGRDAPDHRHRGGGTGRGQGRTCPSSRTAGSSSRATW